MPAILEGFSEFAEGEAVFMDSRKFNEEGNFCSNVTFSVAYTFRVKDVFIFRMLQCQPLIS